MSLCSYKQYQKERIAYSLFAPFYDCWSPFVESEAHKKVLEYARIKDRDSVLEVAVGTGTFFELIVKSNPHGINEGVDVAESMLKHAREKLRKYSNYSLQIGDAYALPFRNAMFDVLINNFMMDLIPPQKMSQVLSEFRRVLKPGGRIVISSMTPGKRWYNKLYNLISVNILSKLSGCVPIELEEVFRSSGFKNIQVEYLSQLMFSSKVYYGEL